MNEQQVKELANKLREHIYNDGSFYAIECVIVKFLDRNGLLPEGFDRSISGPKKP
jgi:hypothetical protein